MPTPMNCVCALCRLPLFEEDAKADHFVYESDGSLDYIELAHRTCAVIDNGKDAIMSAHPQIKPYWDIDPLPYVKEAA